MNYISLINNYWQLREQGELSSGEGDLYLYLVHKSNSWSWKNPFNFSNKILCAFLCISEPTLIRRREKLCEIGLIRFESGKANRENSIYYLNDFSGGVSSPVSSNIVSESKRSLNSLNDFSSDVEKPLDYIKENNTKSNKKDTPIYPVNLITPNPESDIGIPDHEIEKTAMFIRNQTTILKPPDWIKSQFEGFKLVHFNGVKTYSGIGEIYSHFMNWLKIQVQKELNNKSKNGNEQTGESERVQQEMEDRKRKWFGLDKETEQSSNFKNEFKSLLKPKKI